MSDDNEYDSSKETPNDSDDSISMASVVSSSEEESRESSVESVEDKEKPIEEKIDWQRLRNDATYLLRSMYAHKVYNTDASILSTLGTKNTDGFPAIRRGLWPVTSDKLPKPWIDDVKPFNLALNQEDVPLNGKDMVKNHVENMVALKIKSRVVEPKKVKTKKEKKKKYKAIQKKVVAQVMQDISSHLELMAQDALERVRPIPNPSTLDKQKVVNSSTQMLRLGNSLPPKLYKTARRKVDAILSKKREVSDTQ